MQRPNLPPKVSKSRFVSMGAVSWVYRVADGIVLKYPRDVNAPEFGKETAIYDLLEQHPSCPYVMQSFYRTPIANFLPLMVESLDARLRRNQVLDKLTVLKVLRVEDRRLVERWAAELCAAVAWLEGVGLAHTDLRPSNLLLDERDHLKLADFDGVVRIGETALHVGNAPPWAPLYNDPITGRGVPGVTGPKTEQFAIGSILYCMTRGHEPHWQPGGPEVRVVELFRKGIFPALDTEGDMLDCIIDRCWDGWYESIKDLAEAAANFPGAADMGSATIFDAEDCAQKREECRRLVREGLLQMGDAQVALSQ